jgi:hypothetical protein
MPGLSGFPVLPAMHLQYGPLSLSFYTESGNIDILRTVFIWSCILAHILQMHIVTLCRFLQTFCTKIEATGVKGLTLLSSLAICMYSIRVSVSTTTHVFSCKLKHSVTPYTLSVPLSPRRCILDYIRITDVSWYHYLCNFLVLWRDLIKVFSVLL